MFTDYTMTAEITQDGKLELSDRAEFTKAMRHFKRGKVTVRVEVDRGLRTAQANRYYWLLLGIISNETGHDPDELHEFFKHKFIMPDTIKVLNEEIEVYTTVKPADVFTAYTDRIRRYVLDPPLCIVTPDPDPALRGMSRHAKRGAS